MNKDELKQKIERYETHLNETLRRDLQKCLGSTSHLINLD